MGKLGEALVEAKGNVVSNGSQKIKKGKGKKGKKSVKAKVSAAQKPPPANDSIVDDIFDFLEEVEVPENPSGVWCAYKGNFCF